MDVGVMIDSRLIDVVLLLEVRREGGIHIHLRKVTILLERVTLGVFFTTVLGIQTPVGKDTATLRTLKDAPRLALIGRVLE
jgi:hypothetical protein